MTFRVTRRSTDSRPYLQRSQYVRLIAALAVVRTIQCMNSTYRSPELAQHIRNLIAADVTPCAPIDAQPSIAYRFTRTPDLGLVADYTSITTTIDSNLRAESAYTLPDGRSRALAEVPGVTEPIGSSPQSRLERLGRPGTTGIEVSEENPSGRDRP